MHHQRRPTAFLGVVALGLSIGGLYGCSETPSAPKHASAHTPAPKGPAIVIGSISNEPGKEIRTYTPFADYLAEQLAGLGIARAEVIVAPDIPTMADLLNTDKVDLVFDSPFPVMALLRMSDADLLLRRWKKGVGEYHSVIFARADSRIRTLSDLRGKMIAFEEEFSTSSYLLPKASLLNEGLHLTKRPSASAPVAGDDVGFVFSNDDENTFVWVQRHKVDAGAMNNGAFEELSKGSKDYVILHRTMSVPRQLLICRSSLDPRLVEAVRTTLLNMDQTEEGRQVLAQFQKTKKFDAVGDRLLELLEPLNELIAAEIVGEPMTATVDGSAVNETHD